MRLIAHRGLTRGPNKNIENNPKTIWDAWTAGFDCEIDLWRIEDRWYLGHDDPKYLVDDSFLYSGKSWFHCKNREALRYLASSTNGINYFWHDKDDYTLTSRGYIWAYPGQPGGDSTICCLPENVMPVEEIYKLNTYGICSDYVALVKEMKDLK